MDNNRRDLVRHKLMIDWCLAITTCSLLLAPAKSRTLITKASNTKTPDSSHHAHLISNSHSIENDTGEGKIGSTKYRLSRLPVVQQVGTSHMRHCILHPHVQCAIGQNRERVSDIDYLHKTRTSR
jgi:hypothetical protein